MRILIVSDKAGQAGSQYSVSYLAHGLCKRGHHIFLACPPNTFLSQLIQNSAVQHIPLIIKNKLDRQAIKQVAQIVQQFKIEIINAQASKDRYITILAKWLYKLPVKLVHTRRQMAMSIGMFGQSWFYEKGTDKIVAVSQGVKESLVRLGISTHHIKVIHNGTPTEKYKNIDLKKVEELKKKYRIQKDDVVIGSVARLKEQHQILQALASIDKKVKVIFVGIHEQPTYKPIIQQFTVPHEIYYTGSVSGEEVLPYYKLFTMKILASTIEGLSQALLEAMALEVPVIATKAGGNPTLIQHGKNGLLFDNNDIMMLTQHIQKLAVDPALRKKLATNAKKTALEDFSIEHTVTHYECFFEELLAT